MNETVRLSLRLPVRLVLLGFLTVVIQEAAVSQISIFGVSADLTPLVVMSVGLLTGSLLGAITGFGVGLFVDLVLVQTLGVTSLLYIAIGYGSGRLRELRDPSHGLVPLALGAAATAIAGIGMALIQFLLGVDAPVSWLLIQQLFITILVNTLIALPVYALVRRIIQPALPEDPRRRRRRAYTTGGLSPLQRPSERLGQIPRSAIAMMQTPEDRRPPLTPQLALRVAIVGSVALAMFAIIFFRLWFLQVLSGDQYLAKASVNRVRTLAVPAARGQILDRDGHILVDSKPSIAVQLSPPDLPRNGAKRRRMYARLAQVLGIPTQRRSCTIIGGPHVVHARLAPIACAVAQQHALLPYANVTIKTDVSDAVHGYLAERQDQFPGVSVEQVWLRRYPLHDLAAQLFGTVGPITQAELNADALPRRQPAVDRRPVRPGVVLRPLPARPGRRRARAGRRPRPVQGLPVRAQADRRALAQAVAQPGPPEGRPAGALAGDREQPTGTGGRVRRAQPGQRRGVRDGLLPDVRPEHLHQAVERGRLPEAQQRLERLPAVQPGDPEFVPDRLDVQGHHGDRGAAERRLEPRLDLRRHRRLSERSRRHASQRRPRRLRRDQPHPGDPGVLGQLLLQPRAAAQRRPDQAPQGGCAAAVGAWFRHRSPDGDRPRR